MNRYDNQINEWNKAVRFTFKTYKPGTNVHARTSRFAGTVFHWKHERACRHVELGPGRQDSCKLLIREHQRSDADWPYSRAVESNLMCYAKLFCGGMRGQGRAIVSRQ